MRVYVAGSSNELTRAKAAIALVRAAGHEVTSDWPPVIEKQGEANPRDVTIVLRAGWADMATRGITLADVVWLLAPEVGMARGAFFEFGFAFAQGKPVIVSGPEHACSVFTALGVECATDAEGYGTLLTYAEMRGV